MSMHFSTPCSLAGQAVERPRMAGTAPGKLKFLHLANKRSPRPSTDQNSAPRARHIRFNIVRFHPNDTEMELLTGFLNGH